MAFGRFVVSLVFFVVIANAMSKQSLTDDQQVILDTHNHHRATVKPCPPVAKLPKMTWNYKLEKAAALYAEKCHFGHTDGTLIREVTGIQGWVGENLWMGTTGFYDSKLAVDSWVSEVKDYNYCYNTCTPGKMCGHYTQVVWNESTTVGCSKKACNKGNAAGKDYLVCFYFPGGNVADRRPFSISSEDFDAYCSGKKSMDADCNAPIDDDLKISQSISSTLEKPSPFPMAFCFIFATVRFASDL